MLGLHASASVLPFEMVSTSSAVKTLAAGETPAKPSHTLNKVIFKVLKKNVPQQLG